MKTASVSEVRKSMSAGILHIGAGKPPIDLILRQGPRLPEGVSIVPTVLEERRSGW